MKAILIILLAAVGGFIVGMILSDIIGIISRLAFHQTAGIKFLPFITAFISVSVASIRLNRRR